MSTSPSGMVDLQIYPLEVSKNSEDKRVFLTPAGAMVALICFLLPWVKISCGRMVRTFSGPDIGGIFWLILVAALAIIVAFFYFRSGKQAEKSRPFIIVGSIVAFLAIIIKYVSLAWGQKNLLVKVGSKVIDFTIQIGAIGTIFGFILAIIGSVLLKKGDDQLRKTGR